MKKRQHDDNDMDNPTSKRHCSVAAAVDHVHYDFPTTIDLTESDTHNIQRLPSACYININLQDDVFGLVLNHIYSQGEFAADGLYDYQASVTALYSTGNIRMRQRLSRFVKVMALPWPHSDRSPSRKKGCSKAPVVKLTANERRKLKEEMREPLDLFRAIAYRYPNVERIEHKTARDTLYQNLIMFNRFLSLPLPWRRLKSFYWEPRSQMIIFSPNVRRQLGEMYYKLSCIVETLRFRGVGRWYEDDESMSIWSNHFSTPPATSSYRSYKNSGDAMCADNDYTTSVAFPTLKNLAIDKDCMQSSDLPVLPNTLECAEISLYLLRSSYITSDIDFQFKTVVPSSLLVLKLHVQCHQFTTDIFEWLPPQLHTLSVTYLKIEHPFKSTSAPKSLTNLYIGNLVCPETFDSPHINDEEIVMMHCLPSTLLELSWSFGKSVSLDMCPRLLQALDCSSCSLFEPKETNYAVTLAQFTNLKKLSMIVSNEHNYGRLPPILEHLKIVVPQNPNYEIRDLHEAGILDTSNWPSSLTNVHLVITNEPIIASSTHDISISLYIPMCAEILAQMMGNLPCNIGMLTIEFTKWHHKALSFTDFVSSIPRPTHLSRCFIKDGSAKSRALYAVEHLPPADHLVVYW